MTDSGKKQMGFPKWEPTTRWFHIFRSMIDSGDVIKLGSGAMLTYLVIKSYVDFEKGISFPSLDLIAVKSGASVKTVHKHIKKLIELGYVRKLDTKRKGNVYKLREQVPIELLDDDKKNLVPMIASWDYVPVGVAEAMKDIRKVMIGGNLPEGSQVHIENLTVNVQVNPSAELAIQNLNLDDIKNKEIRKAFERMLNARGKS